MTNYKLKLKALLHDPIDKLLVIEEASRISIDPSHKCNNFQSHKRHEKVAEDLFRYLIDECPHEDIIKTADHLSSALSRIVVAPQFKDKDSQKEQFEKESSIGLNEAKFIDIFSGKVKDIQVPNDHEEVEQFFEKLGSLFRDQNERAKFLFLFLWRFLHEIFPWVETHPADSRAPNHSIYDHLVQTSAVVSALPKPAFLLFTISPVQEFISKARKTSDLWAGSYILSYLTYKAIEVIMEELGPDNVIFPNLLGQPLVDRWLYKELKNSPLIKVLTDQQFDIPQFKAFISWFEQWQKWENSQRKPNLIDEELTIANFPNRFLAIVPYEKQNDKEYGKKLAGEVEEAVKKELENLAEKVERELRNELKTPNLQVPQIRTHLLSHFQIYWVLMPWTNDTQGYSPEDALNDYKEIVSDKTETYEVVEIIKNHPYYKPANVGSAYSLLLELTERLLGARKSIRNHIQDDYYESEGEKCHLCGQFEVLDINWDKLAKSHKIKSDIELVNNQVKVKATEKLCGVCLTKRLFPDVIVKVLNLNLKEEIKFPSTAEMASIGEKRRIDSKIKNDFASKFNQFKNNKNLPPTRSVPKLKNDPLYKIDGQWLMEESYREEYFRKEYGLYNVRESDYRNILDFIKENKIDPSRYYAILMMDGDNIGKWLKGKFNPKIKDTIHPKTRDVLIKYSQKDKDLKKLLCLIHPPSPSIHQAFSRKLTKFALEEVMRIVEDEHYGKLVYAGGDDVLALLPIDEVLSCAYELQRTFKDILSPKASMSAGIVIVHYKYPLYLALEEVRNAEKLAKNEYGRNAFCIKVLRHSGEYRIFGGGWDEIEFIEEMICEFINEQIPSRFAYDFAEVVNEIGTESKEVLSLELKRIYKRKEKGEERFLVKLIDKFNNYRDVHDFINLLLISKFLADQKK